MYFKKKKKKKKWKLQQHIDNKLETKIEGCDKIASE